MVLSKPITAIIVGAGHRGFCYASYAKRHPEEFQIVGVADPNEFRRQAAAKHYDLSPDMCFNSAEELAARGRIADSVINATMDQDHVATSLPLLEAGYDLLLEKPIATSKDDLLKLLDATRKYNRKVMICHVLRYAPFYFEMRKRITSGELGEIISINTRESVSYHHMSVGFVRGKWNRQDVCGSSMLMAKCCHDMDILTWMKSGSRPVSVSSFGGIMYFKPEKAPAGAGTRCLVDCPIEPDCLYSAKKIYLDHPNRWSFYVWSMLEEAGNGSMEQKIESLKNDNPHGRCVWKCDNNVVDHQSVIVEFEDGSTASHELTGGTSKPARYIHIIGTEGEIQGINEQGKFIIRHPDPRPGHQYSEEEVDLKVSGDMHGGGDLRLVEDFVRVLRGEEPSLASTFLEDSIYGHLVGFGADQSRVEKRVIDIEKL